MARDPRYDILFEPVRIGPVTAKNRFYQVPHCTGMGYLRPQMLAEMRGVKAEGGWGVVCTEYNSIHPTSDDLPHASAALWDGDDIASHRMMTEKVHAHGGLAGAELWYGGARSPNNFTREVAMDVTSMPNLAGHPSQTRAMDKTDIRNLRRWHRKAALRARDAGFDIVYVYASHGYLLANFIDPRANTRIDEYGGSLENRLRLVRELIEDAKDAVGDRCAVAVRMKADESIGEDGVPIPGERREMFEHLADLPDLWDVNIANYTLEMGVSRFTKEASLEPYMAWVKSVTTKPVVTVGRFTSPDTMVSQVKRGITDLIGAARPSIADPFLPKKVEEGRLEDIRECIGCNICYSGDSLGVPIRCTQNPTMGEEWRKGWHPERMSAPAPGEGKRVLIVGAGPAGLEAARTLGLRGYEVMLAEAGRELGGRVTREASLPGMSEYIRVRDYREQQLAKMPNVEIFRESRLAAADVFEVAPDHVAIATGARWRRDRFDGKTFVPVAHGKAEVFTADDIMEGRLPEGPVAVFDGENYYLASVVAERLRQAGLEVTYVTAEDSVARWAGNTSERWRVRSHLMRLGVSIETAQTLMAFDGMAATLACAYSGAKSTLPVNGVVLVTARDPLDGLYHEILAQAAGDGDATGPALPFTLSRIGDCEAPGIVAAAVYAGHRYGAELDLPRDLDEPLRHDRPKMAQPAPAAASSAPAPNRQAEPVALKPGYLATLLQYYEEEIAGEAYYRALAERLPLPQQKTAMVLLAAVERHTAALVRPLIEKHGLNSRPDDVLEAEGRRDADQGPQDWDGLIATMRRTFPDYIPMFRALEGMAPPEDRPRLALMTAHEDAAIAFLEATAAGDPDPTGPLLAFLGRGPELDEAA